MAEAIPKVCVFVVGKETIRLLVDERKTLSRVFALEDGIAYMTIAAEAIAQDEFSKCFEPKPRTWSLRDGWVTYPIYAAGVCIRYGVLFPIRLGILLCGSMFFFLMLPVAKNLDIEYLKRWLFRFYCNIWLLAFSAFVRHHGVKPTLSEPHIFVANHTSYIDWILASSHRFPHATAAQRHGGLLGYLMKYVLSLNGTVMFERKEKNDRSALQKRIQEHVSDPSRTPLIIFPEGTCVNNEYTVLFHKGAFELGVKVCPVAIKYNKQLCDPYWNTREQTFTHHALYLMTRWTLVADIWWMPPQKMMPGETSIDFANRVKAMISDQAHLVNLSWDGYLKNFPEQSRKLRGSNQHRFSSILLQRIDQIGTLTRTTPAMRLSRMKRSKSTSGVSSQGAAVAALANSHQRQRELQIDATNSNNAGGPQKPTSPSSGSFRASEEDRNENEMANDVSKENAVSLAPSAARKTVSNSAATAALAAAAAAANAAAYDAVPDLSSGAYSLSDQSESMGAARALLDGNASGACTALNAADIIDEHGYRWPAWMSDRDIIEIKNKIIVSGPERRLPSSSSSSSTSSTSGTAIVVKAKVSPILASKSSRNGSSSTASTVTANSELEKSSSNDNVQSLKNPIQDSSSPSAATSATAATVVSSSSSTSLDTGSKENLVKTQTQQSQQQQQQPPPSPMVGAYRQDILDQLRARKEDIATSWKLFTKMKDMFGDARRLENISWRLWAAERIKIDEERRGTLK